MEEAFRNLNGVVSTSVGYMGGEFEDPTYQDVCTGGTGHAETVEVIYDPTLLSYQDLLNVFWKSHDPTTLNRQGPDIGEQYRSVIFYHNEEQEKLALYSRDELEKSDIYKRRIVTQIVPATKFYMAEEYHQQYLEKRGRRSCKF